jgi:manganese transport protein
MVFQSGKTLAFAGPGYLVAVGYMDQPMGYHLAGGSKFGYALLSSIDIGLMAMLLQHLSSSWASSRERLSSNCHDHYPPAVRKILWILEVAITACDLAEVIGSAIALNLLLGLPILIEWCTAFDTILLLLCKTRLTVSGSARYNTHHCYHCQFRC